MAKPITYREMLRWLQKLEAAQLDAPVLCTGGADDFGATEYLTVVALVDVAREHETISGGYEGPVLLIREQEAVKERQARDFHDSFRNEE